MDRNNEGILAAQAGFRDMPLQVLKSNVGWYIGTMCPFTGPISRESVEYFSTEEEANEALETGVWTQKTHP